MSDSEKNISGESLLTLAQANLDNGYVLAKSLVPIYERFLKPLRNTEDTRIVLLNPQSDDLAWLLTDYLPEADIFCVSYPPKKHLGFDNVYVFSSQEFRELPHTVEYNMFLDDSRNVHEARELIAHWGRLKRDGLFVIKNAEDLERTKAAVSMKPDQVHSVAMIDERLSGHIIIYKK